jgi:DNA-binding NtrC family response regulator
MYRKGEVPSGRQRQVSILCIDNHASSQYACFLLARSGYKVTYAGFLCDALDLIHRSSYDLYVVNDELACGPGKDLFEKVRKAAAATPIVFYSTVVYPFSPRSADQSGSTPDTPVPLTEIAIAVGRAIADISTRPTASTRAA